jgi:FKBP-type peptidyl-prolyl cis-trans isomerase (trigger factor)
MKQQNSQTISPATATASSLHSLHINIEHERPHLCTITVTIPKECVNALYAYASSDQKQVLQTIGFNKGEVPLQYIGKNYSSALTEHVQEFLFRYMVLPFLYREIRHHKLAMSGEPRLADIHLLYDQQGEFTFELSLIEKIGIQEWRHFPFKAANRKKYRDLDRQVDSFVNDELHALKEFSGDGIIAVNDWVHFAIEPIYADGAPVFAYEPLKLWLKMGDEEADALMHAVFLQRRIGETFTSQGRGLQTIFSNEFETNYLFSITVLDVLHNAYFCLDLFKKYFKIKTQKDMLQKLIEVFSYRNNLSQRRTMVEEALMLMLSKHSFSVPAHILLRQQEAIIETICQNPDYPVYKAQKDFNERIEQLAEKMVKEMALLDQLAYHDNIIASDGDIKAYLNLLKRPRAKEFVYFDHPVSKIDGKEQPFCTEELRHICTREKTINTIIYHLTRK